MNTSKSPMNKDETSAFHPMPSIPTPFFSPFIAASNDFHAHLALLRPFLSFWQTFPFLRPPGPIPSPIRPRASTTMHNPSKPALINFFHSTNETTKSRNLKKYKCDVCLRAFSRSNTLVTHKRIHTGEKPFICNICDRAFRQPGNLTRHKLIHTATKPYVCEICTKAFNRLSNLQAHKRTHAKAIELNLEKCSSDNSEQD